MAGRVSQLERTQAEKAALIPKGISTTEVKSSLFWNSRNKVLRIKIPLIRFIQWGISIYLKDISLPKEFFAPQKYLSIRVFHWGGQREVVIAVI